MGGESDGCGRKESQQGEDGLPSPVGISPAICEKQRLEVVTQSDGDDGKVGGESEDREEGEEDVEGEEEPGVGRRRLEVESVEIIEVSEGEYSCECQKEIEAEYEPVVGQNERVEPPLVTDRSDKTRERVMTHEAVDTNSEQVGQTTQCGGGRSGGPYTCQSDGGQDNHDREGQPSEHN